MKIPSILIIIVTWNKKKYVLDLLESVNKLVYEKEYIKVLLVDNASTDGTVQAVSDLYSDVEIISNEENLGGTGGFNTGLEWAFNQPDGKFDYLWLLDNDVVVNQRALIELVKLLENNSDAAVAGSSMMQLDYPWRINEIGSYYNRSNGKLMLNFHGVPVIPWQGLTIEKLVTMECDLSDYIPDFQSEITVDYVAAASLLVRADVAKKVGIWENFFIHFDDVEWCLRIADMGYRVLASCRSLIWHMSAAAKVSSGMIYYDIRNSLKVLDNYGFGQNNVHQAVKLELKRSVYYALLGRMDIAHLVLDAVDDFNNSIMGKKDIKLSPFFSHRKQELHDLPFMKKEIKRVLIPWTVNMYATGLHDILLFVQKHKPELIVDFMTMPGGLQIHQFPRAGFIKVSANRLFRIFQYMCMRNRYDLVIQSEYQRVLGLSWIGKNLMFLNNTSYCLRLSPNISDVIRFITHSVLKRCKIVDYLSKKINKSGLF